MEEQFSRNGAGQAETHPHQETGAGLPTPPVAAKPRTRTGAGASDGATYGEVSDWVEAAAQAAAREPEHSSFKKKSNSWVAFVKLLNLTYRDASQWLKAGAQATGVNPEHAEILRIPGGWLLSISLSDSCDSECSSPCTPVQRHYTDSDMVVRDLVLGLPYPMTTTKLMSFAAEHHVDISESTLKHSLGKLVAYGDISNDPRAKPAGYGPPGTDGSAQAERCEG